MQPKSLLVSSALVATAYAAAFPQITPFVAPAKRGILDDITNGLGSATDWVGSVGENGASVM